MSKPASKSAAKAAPPEYKEFAVRREGFNRFFDKPLPTSTFHDKVNEGFIVPLKGVKGFYKLNDSLARLGLRPVMKLPDPLPTRTIEDIVRLAFSAIDPDVFPAPTWLLDAEAIDGVDASHAGLLVEKHAAHVAKLDSDREKQAYLQGVLDAAYMVAADTALDSQGLP
jgi:hypothetical protein